MYSSLWDFTFPSDAHLTLDGKHSNHARLSHLRKRRYQIRDESQLRLFLTDYLKFVTGPDPDVPSIPGLVTMFERINISLANKHLWI